jgi:murein L,D-transpeptidase YcbB/YkuD
MGCGRGPQDATEAHAAVISVSTAGAQQLSADGAAALKGYLQAGQLPDLQYPSFQNYRAQVMEFYESAGDRLPWVLNSRPSRQSLAMIAALETADNEGLNPIDYDGPRWAARLGRLEASPPSESDLVRFDLALTISTMRYVSNLHRGRVNPGELHFDLDIEKKDFDLSGFLLKKLVNAEDVQGVLRDVEPPFPGYRRTVEALRTYRALARKVDDVQLPVPGKPVRPGNFYNGVASLGRLLEVLGDLPEAGRGNLDVPDAIYSGRVMAAVKHFQHRHGVEPSGVLDAQTFTELNKPLSERVMQLQLTLERWRWLPHEFARPPIVVNIPEFRLYAANEDYRAAFSIKIVAGRSYKHQTPVFASEVRSIIFRPYWNVPLDIVRKELLPAIRKDPGNYLQKHDYEVVDAKLVVVSDTIVTESMERQLYAGKLGIRQRPGAQNSLGLVKFDMPNPFDVYMHGTPAKQLFSRSRRDFSHGCIRLEDPVALAEWLLRDQPEWDAGHIVAAMNGDQTFRVNLSKPVPVLILYGTAVVTEQGEVHFYDDIYGHDATLERALAGGFPYSMQ